MSSNTVEAFLYKMGNDRAVTADFIADPNMVLDRFPLSEVEKASLLHWDLHAIVASGVSPMLLMFGYLAANGGVSARDEYIRLLKQSPRD